MISNFFVLSPRGDTIIFKQYRTSNSNTLSSDSNSSGTTAVHERSHTEAFFRKIKFWDDSSMSVSPSNALDAFMTANNSNINNASSSTTTMNGGIVMDPASNSNDTTNMMMESNPMNGGAGTSSNSNATATTTTANKKTGDAPPVFPMPDGLTYFHIKRNGLLFAASTIRNVSPNTVLELLATIARIFKDYCGTLSEEALRKNFILCYELLDEMMDYGYPQVTRTETLKSFVYNEPIVVESIASTGSLVNPKTASASAVHKPVISSVHENGRKTALNNQQKNEIFVDILERLNVLFSNNGYVLNSTIDGCIQMKSYLAGNPQLRLALNEDLVIGKDSGRYGSVVVDDMNFNDCLNMMEWDHARTLSFIPPDGEFTVLNYRMTGEFSTPFRMFPAIEETAPNKIEITVLIRAEMPNNHFGANVIVEIPLPKAVIAGVTCNLLSAPGTGPAAAEYVPAESKIIWTMKKFPGGSEQTMKCKVSLLRPCTTVIRQQIGPINMCFEIPMYNVSNVQVRYLRVAENMVGYTPYRWVRYVTQSSSYVCRL